MDFFTRKLAYFSNFSSDFERSRPFNRFFKSLINLQYQNGRRRSVEITAISTILYNSNVSCDKPNLASWKAHLSIILPGICLPGWPFIILRAVFMSIVRQTCWGRKLVILLPKNTRINHSCILTRGNVSNNGTGEFQSGYMCVHVHAANDYIFVQIKQYCRGLIKLGVEINCMCANAE